MKTITNILSYLWLLLLMAVTACSDLEEEVGPMKGEEEVELTIRTQVPGMKVGTRAAETENLTTITALVFNAEKELIKKVDNIVTSATDGTQGTFTLKVPLRTRSIHFIGNPTGVNLPSVPSEGDAAVTHDALKTLTTTGSLAYWGYASFADVAALRDYKDQTLILYRNKAKISIEKAGSFNGSLAIAGLENVYKKGVLVPHYGDEFNFNLTNYDYQTLPTSVSNEEKGQEQYEPTVTETYVFEHPNDEGNRLFAICLIDNKYYKVALAKNNSGTLSYYDIIRNHQYRIKINAINESLGQDYYDDAVNSDPINNAEAEVEETKDAVLTIESISASELVYNAGSKELSMTVNIPEGVSALTINASNFTASTTDGNLSSTGNNAFNVNSAGSVTFTLTLKDGVGSRGQQETISVVGTAKEGYRVTNPDSKTIILKEQVSLQTSLLEGVSSLMYSNEENSESDLIVNVTIPAGVTTLEFSSDYFDLISVNGRTKTENEVSTPYISVSNDGYSVNHQGESSLTLPFRLRLKSEKKAPTSTAWFEFDGSGEGVKVVPATMNITLTENDDENVRWQGDVLLNWGNEGAVTQIPLPYSWFEGLSSGSTLRVDYVVTDADKSEKDRDAVIQFTEVRDDSWTDSPYDFAELKENDGEDAGVNLSKDTKSGSIYDRGGVIKLELTQTILNKMVENKTTFDGLENIVMAIQGGNVRLKKISVIPATENPTPAGWSTIWSGTTQLDWQNTFVQVNKFLPIGTNVTLNFSATNNNAQLELHDSSQDSFRLSNQNHPEGDDDYLVISQSGDNSISFTVNNEYITKLDNLSTGLNGLIIMGTNITMKSIVVKYPDGYVEEEEGVEIFNFNFDNNSTEGLDIQYQEDADGTYGAPEGSLVLDVTEASNESWHAQVRYFMSIEKDATYKLTFKVKSTVAGDLSIILDNTGNWQSCGNFTPVVSLTVSDNWTDVETTATATATFTDNGRFVINFGHLDGTIYIDDLKLVKKLD